MLIIRSTSGYLFGAYLSHVIRDNNTWTGNPTCFLFNLNYDIKIPYHGKYPLNNNNDIKSFAFIGNENKLTIGNNDLVIYDHLLNNNTNNNTNNNSNINIMKLSQGTSELEGCFGIGMVRNSNESKSFLAGSPSFVIENIELWSIR